MPSKDKVTIDVYKLNGQFDRLLDKAFNVAFLSLENIRNGELLTPFDCATAVDDIDTKKLLAQLQVCENQEGLAALQPKKHDYLEGKKDPGKKYDDEEIQKQWFINKVAYKLRAFMDKMIETRVFLPSNTEEDALKLFAQNRMLMKRGVLTQ